VLLMSLSNVMSWRVQSAVRALYVIFTASFISHLIMRIILLVLTTEMRCAEIGT